MGGGAIDAWGATGLPAVQPGEWIYCKFELQDRLGTPTCRGTIIDAHDNTYDLRNPYLGYGWSGVGDIVSVSGSMGHSIGVPGPFPGGFDDIVVAPVPITTGFIADFDDSCTVGIEDLNVITSGWLDCVDPEIASCDSPWDTY